MSKKMTCESLGAFFKSLSAADLRALDNSGGLVAWCPNRGFMLSIGDPSDRAFHEWIQHDGLISTTVWTAWQEFKTKPSELRALLVEQAEANFCSLEMKLDQKLDQGE